MEILPFILLLVIGGPIARALAHRIARTGGPVEPPSPELRNALQATEQRLADTELRLAAVEEKLDFYEKLLSNPERKPKSADPPAS